MIPLEVVVRGVGFSDNVTGRPGVSSVAAAAAEVEHGFAGKHPDVFGDHLEGFEPSLLRFSGAVGVTTVSAPTVTLSAMSISPRMAHPQPRFTPLPIRGTPGFSSSPLP